MYNHVGGFLLCPKEACQYALTLFSFKQYLKLHQKSNEVSLAGSWIKELKEVFAPLKLTPQLLSNLHNVQSFSGLPTCEVFQCLFQGNVREYLKFFTSNKNNKSFWTYLSNYSCGLTNIPASHKGPIFWMVSAQQFFLGHPYFLVILPSPHPNPISPITEVSSSADAPLATTMSQWLANLDTKIDLLLQTPNHCLGDNWVIEKWINKLF